MMKTRLTVLLVGAVFAGLGALTFPPMPEMPRGGVVLSRTTPPPVPETGLDWSGWDLTMPVSAGPASPGQGPDTSAAEHSLPVSQSPDPGVWGTPAQFAESD